VTSSALVEQEHARLSHEVRAFLAEQRRAGIFEPMADSWLAGFSAEFSRALGRRGWLGMTWPRKYGGGGRSAAERFCVLEELLAAGAPVAAHWAGDRQVGPSLLRNGTEAQRMRYLPGMARGEIYFCLGLSEPEAGSDLASVRTKAVRRSDGSWALSGRKVWTSGAHKKHFMLTLCRTEDSEDKHAGLTQFIVDLSHPGVTVRPILLMSGEHHFNEVVLDDVIVPADGVLGESGSGWEQVTTELADERAGPERYMSTFPAFLEFGRAVMTRPASMAAFGCLAARFWSVRALSRQVADAVDSGSAPALEAALAKDVGTRVEQESVEVMRHGLGPAMDQSETMRRLLCEAILHSPGFTLRGGTTEMLRSVIARKLGM
jgi:acyl-CoA dehydrogenase